MLQLQHLSDINCRQVSEAHHVNITGDAASFRQGPSGVSHLVTTYLSPRRQGLSQADVHLSLIFLFFFLQFSSLGCNFLLFSPGSFMSGFLLSELISGIFGLCIGFLPIRIKCSCLGKAQCFLEVGGGGMATDCQYQHLLISSVIICTLCSPNTQKSFSQNFFLIAQSASTVGLYDIK